ncbi:hypothetical protein AUEXF2481DRAFT_233239 [Aureobasidium subglaciale EXF-2481]|uniref:Uncharacterized protein n=1 Tax=Aureobasidium subglaciale (strain EXF-2481) TaxID=1043005 RepID=A0A074YG67_AURSE|nr:uncharacterized protein AUEXF2481DRAFT_233239 [Aureobasidium subglaciale EXF-2481]KEQ95054.1 hypothetical protein AUEXF2481DRAFT_233239 [Aureobasidium subglaciale EXF-2481]
MSQSTTPVKQAKPPAAAGSEKDPLRLIEKLEVKTKAVNANNVARVANSHLVSADDKLHPLLSLKNGRTLEKFPESPKALAKLSVALVDAMLSALEADRNGNEMEKRERLRLQIGLKPNPA